MGSASENDQEDSHEGGKFRVERGRDRDLTAKEEREK